MRIMLFIRIGYGRFGGHLGHLVSFRIINLSHIESFRRTNFNALIFMLLGFLNLLGDSIR